MKRKRLIALVLALCTLLCLLAGCNKTGGKDNGGEEAPTEAKNEKKDYGSIGSMNGVQYDEKYGNLISPYTRCQISLETEAQTFAYRDGAGETLYTEAEKVETSFSDTQGTAAQSFDNGARLETDFLAQGDGSLDIAQHITVTDGGISEVRFKLTVPMKYDVIIPAWDGICLNAEHPDIYDKRSTISYPREWQAQMLLIQGTNGGILVQARDDGTQFKALNIGNDGENFELELCTVPQAPFTDYTSFDTVIWSVIPYEGTWMDGALLYKQYMEETFKLSELNESEPDWAKDIQLVWMDDLDSKNKLDLLAKEVDPEKTLIQIGGWRRAAYDTEYPDYTPKDGIVEMIQYAQSLGFKVSLHCNMLGCAFDSDVWKNGMSEEACLDAYSLETIVEGYTAFGKDYRFGQINQASVKWQDLMVEIMKQVIEDTGADCIHLDQSLICFNDGRGYVNDMTTMQGNVELQRKLAEALPGIAFSGEGINEFNMRYADFLQQHIYGLDSNAKTWDDEFFEQILPITTVLFGDYTKTYHYPALPTTAEENEEYYLAWYRAGNIRSGHIPCLYRESEASLLEPTDTITLVLDAARFNMENEPVINTEPWEQGVVMSTVLKDGTVAEWRETDEDLCFYPNRDDETPAITFVHGTDTYTTDRNLKGWILYDENELKGLRVEKSYLLQSKLRDNDASHITQIQENLTTRGFIANDAYTAIALQEIIPSNKRVVDFTAYDGEMRGGEVLYDGSHNETATFNSMQSFWYTLPRQGQVRHMGDRIMFHPPWVDEAQNIGYTWFEVDVPLEVLGNASFNASFQLATAESAAGSDGVVFKVLAWDKDDTEKKNVVSTEVTCLSEIALPVSLDLTQFEGKTVTVRVECYVGETPRNDSCHMVAPQIVQDKGKVEREVTYSVKTHAPVTGIISVSGNAVYEDNGENNYTVTSDINDTVWLLHTPKAIGNETDMTQYPFIATWQMASGEATSPTGDLAPQEMVIESQYELRNGIFQHPPQNGVSVLSWLITLPENSKPHFDAAIAMKKGSIQSDGVTFSVLVNGTEVFSKVKEGSSGFEDIRIDLSEYAGQTIILTLQTDSGETSAYDYAFWGDPLFYTK